MFSNTTLLYNDSPRYPLPTRDLFLFHLKNVFQVLFSIVFQTAPRAAPCKHFDATMYGIYCFLVSFMVIILKALKFFYRRKLRLISEK